MRVSLEGEAFTFAFSRLTVILFPSRFTYVKNKETSLVENENISTFRNKKKITLNAFNFFHC